MGSNDVASAEAFGTWLGAAMRRAGYDIDAQRGGGRIALAAKMKISKSTVTRWLSGEVLPAAEYFEPLADALGVPTTEVLIGAGIIRRKDLSPPEGPINVSDVLEEWGITDLADQNTIISVIERFREHGPINELADDIRTRLAAPPKFTEPPEE